MRAGVLWQAVCQDLLHILSARFASIPLALCANSRRLSAMPYGVNESRLSQSHALLRVVFCWFYVTCTFVENVVGACSVRNVYVSMRAAGDTQNQGTGEAKERRTGSSAPA